MRRGENVVQWKPACNARWLAAAFLALANVAITLTPFWESDFAGHWFAIAIVDYLVIWKVVLRRPLGAFSYIFIIIFIHTYGALTNLVVVGRLPSARSITRFHQYVTGTRVDGDALLRVIGFWLSGIYGFAVALAAGLLARRLERRRGWGIAVFVRGALLGLCVGAVFAILERETFGPSGACWVAGNPSPFSYKAFAIRAFVMLSGVAGGVISLKRLRHDHAAKSAFADIR